MHHTRYVLLMVFLLICSSLIFAQDGGTPSESPHAVPDERLSFQHGDIERFYRLHLPPDYDAANGAPLLIALHGSSTSSASLAALTDLNAAADPHGFIIAYPDAYDRLWNDGRAESNLGELGESDDDVDFLTALVQYLRETYTLTEVHLLGYKGGGLMAYRMACETPSLFASVVIVGPLAYQYHKDICPQNVEGAADMLIIHGDGDGFFRPFDMNRPMGFDTPETYTVFGVDSTLSLFSDLFGCSTRKTDFKNNTVSVSGCEDDHTLTYYRVRDAVSEWLRVGDYRLNRFGIDTTAIVMAYLSGAEDWAMPQTAEFTEHPRSYNVFVPSAYDASEPLPVVFVLHGRPGSGTGMSFITDMNSVAERENFIVIYPDGQFEFTPDGQLDRYWGYTRNNPFFRSVYEDDTQYLKDLLHDVALDLNIDLDRAYVTGFSNGGFMTHRLACEATDTFAAFAPVGATAFAGFDSLCTDSPPVPLFYMHGTHDRSVPWNGLPVQATVAGEVREVYSTWPVENTVTFWLQHNGCTSQPTEEMIPGADSESPTEVWVYRFDCAENAPVEFWGVLNGGHNWPGVPDVISESIAGDVNVDIHASEVIWEFFKQHTLSERQPE